MKNLTILIISRIIFPVNSPRAFRTTELATELARQGHKVTVYAVLGKHNYSDFERETGVKISNIGNMLFATKDSDGRFRYTLVDKILYHLLHRLIEFPDIEFMFRVPDIIRQEKGIDMLITIAYPHPIHWGGALAKRRIPAKYFPKTWISDCGDPYMGDPINKKKFFYFKYVEKWWCRNTDYISIPLEEGKQGYYTEFHKKIKVVPQGFNFGKVRLEQTNIQNKVPNFAYAGSIYQGKRDPKSFLNFLITFKQNFKFIVYTNAPNYYTPFKTILKEKLEIRPYIPREQLIYELSKMDFLVNFKNPDNIQLPSKMIDYMLTKRPVINISTVFSKDEQSIFFEFFEGNYQNRIVESDVEQFNIKNVAQKFLDLYNEKY